MATCGNCGSIYADGSRFCPQCGSQIMTDASEAEVVTETPSELSPVQEDATEEAPYQPYRVQEEITAESLPQANQIQDELASAAASPATGEASVKATKPFYKKPWFIVIIVLVVLAIIGGAAGQKGGSSSSSSSSSSSPSSSTTSSSSTTTAPAKKTISDILAGYGAFEATTVSGYGDDVIDIPCVGYPCIMDIEHNGGGNFAVHLVDKNGNNLDLLVNEIGSFTGTVTDWNYFEKATVISVKAGGDWSITFRPMSSIEIAQNGDSFTGPNVVGIDAGSISKISFTHNGSSNFVVRGVGTSSAKLLVNEIGSYDGTVVWSQPQAFFVVDADGDWTIAW